MNIGEFTALDREAQFAEAGRIAGIAPSVFDGIWRTESGRGANMNSRSGAEGHFQIMPKTRATMEGRFGTTIDPYDFGQALYTSAHLMKENMGRFKNLPDALRAYNGGWNKATWANAETSAYAGKVLGDDLTADPTADSFLAAEGDGMTRPLSPAAALWDIPFSKTGRVPSVAKSAVSKAAQALADIGGAPAPAAEPTHLIYKTSAELRAAAQLEEQRKKDETSFLDASRAAAFHSLPVVIMREISQDPEPVDPNWVVPEEDLKGYDLNEQRDLAATTSQKQFERVKFDIEYGREQDTITFRRGTAFGLGASFLASAPEAMVTGGIASLAFRSAGVGAIALARAGQKGAAIAATTAEGVVGNVINTAALDMLGERQGVNAYVIGAAGGLLNPMLQGRYLGRVADRAAEVQIAERLMLEASQKEALVMAEAVKRLPEGHTREELKDMMNVVEAEGQRADIASHKAAIPESRRMDAGSTDEIEAITTVKQADEILAKEAEAVPVAAAEKPASFVDKLMEEYGPNVRTPYEDPSFAAKQAENARAGQADATLTKLTGKTYAELEQLPKGVNVSDSLRVKMDANLNTKNAVGVIEALASEYLPKNVRLVISDVGKLDATRSNAGPNANLLGGAYSVGDTHVIAVDFDAIKGNRSLTNHVAIHELGHIIFHSNAPLVPRELIARMDVEW